MLKKAFLLHLLLILYFSPMSIMKSYINKANHIKRESLKFYLIVQLFL